MSWLPADGPILSQTAKELTRVGAAGLTALLITLLLTPLVRLTAVRFGWIVKPVESRWGRRVVARLGGVAMFIGFVATTALWVSWEPSVVALLGGVSLVFVLGLVDDFRRIPPYTKLMAQLLIGCGIVLSGIRLVPVHWAWISIPLSVLWFVFVMNAFNLLDNMDGLAAGVGAIAAGFYVLHAALSGQWVVAALAGIVSGVCLGFLRYNFPPAKIFMGDSGSHFLGLSLAALAITGSLRHSTQLVSILAVPTLVLAVPIFDTCFVTVQRLLHRQHPFTGGTDHISHRLAVLGLSVRQTVVALYGASICLGLLSLAFTTLKPLPSLALWSSVLTALMLCGLYLAQVKVYRMGQADSGMPPSHLPVPTTPIGTMLLHKRRLLEIVVDCSVVSSA
ncbi:MAG: MraY family glycosyltransferase [Candidatus Omnitrophota bacterium]|nr:MraY family glycosyltransferase [Candidatus Omnitrophota bacterium]